jgi:DNA polymerase elongation subunit (family B)
MNSLYGKLGSGFERTIMNYIKDDNGYFKIQRKYVNDSDFDYEERRKYYRAFASFTTSYGRIALLSIIIKIEEKFGEESFLYSDTDSIYATLSVQEFKSLGVDLHKSRLGAWDIEKEFTKFKCLGPKKYILYGHEYGKNQKDKISAHCSGLPYNVQKTLNFDNFYLGAVFTKKQKKKVIGGYRLELIKFELKEFSFYR